MDKTQPDAITDVPVGKQNQATWNQPRACNLSPLDKLKLTPSLLLSLLYYNLRRALPTSLLPVPTLLWEFERVTRPGLVRVEVAELVEPRAVFELGSRVEPAGLCEPDDPSCGTEVLEVRVLLWDEPAAASLTDFDWE